MLMVVATAAVASNHCSTTGFRFILLLHKQVTHGINLAAKTSKLALNELGSLNNVNFESIN